MEYFRLFYDILRYKFINYYNIVDLLYAKNNAFYHDYMIYNCIIKSLLKIIIKFRKIVIKYVYKN